MIIEKTNSSFGNFVIRLPNNNFKFFMRKKQAIEWLENQKCEEIKTRASAIDALVVLENPKLAWSIAKNDETLNPNVTMEKWLASTLICIAEHRMEGDIRYISNALMNELCRLEKLLTSANMWEAIDKQLRLHGFNFANKSQFTFALDKEYSRRADIQNNKPEGF
jgi:hypothetical protein